ncbi:MAG: alpha/beta fold hydrolase [Pseudomonadota bacterium]
MLYVAGVAYLLWAGCVWPATTDFKPCHIDDIQTQAQCAYLDVPLDWAEQSGDSLDLFVAVVPPSGGAVTDAPIYVLAGGPGQAASDLGALISGALVPARRGREVILIDQRGTGKTAPFDCDVPLDLSAGGGETARNCLAAAQHDPRHFGSDAFINDIHAVRNALGHNTIHIWGGSYGTRAALLYLARFEHTVQSVVLDAVAAPVTPYLALSTSSAGRALEHTLSACASDPACADTFGDLDAQLDNLLTELATSPRSVPINGAQVDVDHEWFLGGLRGALYSPQSSAWIPLAISQFSEGNSGPWAAMADATAGIVSELSLGTLLSVACGEEVTRLDAKDNTTSVFDGLSLAFFDEACAVWPSAAPPQEHAQAVHSERPVLLLSGEFDPVTPPAFADAAAADLSRSRHLIVPDGGHISTASGCMPELIATFLDTLDPAALDPSCLDKLKRTPFLLGSSGPAP